ncbi:hypothetical protein ILUMI_03917 [Ignelater luminosus]|uniref:PiggyBac transposable element-derived protein domain-containing protein n=1 Tax=Ignelater luminosus TaxID=2038154 RepID=A0A8K0DFE8_IGNLU|nr:hypothetical protein ILUMI_03917 [Ignelater luminosus]
MSAVSEDDEEELEDPYHNTGSFDEDYCPTESDVEYSGQSGEDSDMPNMKRSRGYVSDESEEDEQVVNNTIWLNNYGAFIPRLVLPQQKSGESAFQSNDESIAKFEGKSSMKQYLPVKPIERGVRIWVQSDSSTGYFCDLKIYAGKNTEATSGALRKQVVKNLASSMREKQLHYVLARGLVLLGRSKAAVKKRSVTSLVRSPKIKKRRTMFNVGDHLSIQEKHAGYVADVLLSSERKHGPISA